MTAAEYRRRYQPSEDDIQAACVQWFRLSYPKFRRRLIASLNGAPLMNGVKTWARLKRLGAADSIPAVYHSEPI